MSNILRSQEAEDPPVLACLGANVRALRRQLCWTQAELAVRAGVSRRMLVAIESGGTNVSLSTVDRLAAALGVRFTHLVRAPDAADSRRILALAWRGGSRDSRAELLGGAPGTRETELWMWSLAPGDTYDSEDNSGDWHEMLFVLEGTLVVITIEGDRRVEAGDFLIFSSAERYHFVNAGKGTLRFIRNVVL